MNQWDESTELEKFGALAVYVGGTGKIFSINGNNGEKPTMENIFYLWKKMPISLLESERAWHAGHPSNNQSITVI